VNVIVIDNMTNDAVWDVYIVKLRNVVELILY
jgi:hypothetical protein